MNKKSCYFIMILVIFSSFFIVNAVNAQIEPEEIPATFNSEEISPGFQPVIDTLQPLYRKLNVLVGGIFGLYVILVLTRVYYERKKVKILQDIRYDLDNLNVYYKVPYSKEREKLIKKFFKLFKFNNQNDQINQHNGPKKGKK
ncbi:MAG: hypothetical protein ABH824_07375 [Nanoarchaeota archaeon]|nr:hypothetical protein [Nanoarchaeota archaeon]MBU1632007.1 hypothetical protein [Nanoarchaeota archaeon]MBU1875622.1 hypothetical protein [Nanoarchaeota archaeon]